MRKCALAALALLSLAGRGWAQLSFQPGGSLRIEGDSSLHKWSSTATVVAMTFEVAEEGPQSLPYAITSSKIKGLEVKIPVAGLKSGESGLDKNLRKAMNAEKYPDIVYRLDQYQMAPGEVKGVLLAKTTGNLTIAGQTKPVAIDVEFRLGPNKASIRGNYTLDMSDYGITPPTLMLGTIKVRDPITIRFDLILKPQENAP